MFKIIVLIPCLNEEKTIGLCIEEALDAIKISNYKAEIIVVDNGSTDGTKQIVKSYNVKLLDSTQSNRYGYGANIQYGIANSNADFIFYADSDFSYPFSYFEQFISKFFLKDEDIDIVIGNRFNSNMQKNAMPFLHRYFGTPVLTFIANIIHNLNIKDVHSGMRAIKVNKFIQLGCNSDGMEFAIEMLIKARKQNLNIVNCDINFRRDLRGRESHLRTWRDGWKILKYIFSN